MNASTFSKTASFCCAAVFVIESSIFSGCSQFREVQPSFETRMAAVSNMLPVAASSSTVENLLGEPDQILRVHGSYSRVHPEIDGNAATTTNLGNRDELIWIYRHGANRLGIHYRYNAIHDRYEYSFLSDAGNLSAAVAGPGSDPNLKRNDEPPAAP